LDHHTNRINNVQQAMVFPEYMRHQQQARKERVSFEHNKKQLSLFNQNHMKTVPTLLRSAV